MGGIRIQLAPLLALALLVAPLPAYAGDITWSNAASPGGGPVQGVGGSSAVMVASTWWNGAYRSYDAGLHWEQIPGFPPVSEARVAFDPSDPQVGYVYGFGGVARTLDGGATWTHVLSTTVTYRLGLSPSGSVIASYRDSESYTHLLYSTDRGATWTDINFPKEGTRFMSLYGLAFGHTEQDVVAMNIGKMWRTSDGGATWSVSNHTFLDLQRAPDGTLWAGGFTIAKSADNGATWTSVPAPDTGWPIAVGGDGRVFVPASDGFLTSADGGATWTNLGFGGVAFGATQLFVDPADASAVFFSDENIGVAHVSPQGYGTRTTGLQSIEVLALGASGDGSVLLAGTHLGLYASRDGGDNWAHTGAGMGFIGVFSVGASSDGSVIMGGGQTRVFSPFIVSSRDGGATFTISNPQLGGDGYISGIAFDPADPMHAFAAARMQLATNKVIETNDGGLTWRIVLDLPEGRIWDVAFDAAAGKALIATEFGVLVYEGNGLVSVRSPTLETRTVAARDGRSWSAGPSVSIWSGAGGAPHTPWADATGTVRDISPESSDAVWATGTLGPVWRCAADECTDLSPPADAAAVLVRPDGGAVFAATEEGIYRAII